MARRLFVDLDGVLADFDRHYADTFGVTLDRSGPDPTDLWTNLATTPTWYADLPVLPGALAMFDALRPYAPTLLSGVPTSLPSAPADKRRWVDRHLGADVPLITCKSAHKRKYGNPGDVLVDDWGKYRHLWEKMGGTFILHDPKNPDASVAAVRALLG
jgi:hypothetical protein